MQINKIAQNAADFTRETGKKIINHTDCSDKAGKFLHKINKFVEGESYNPGRGAYYFLMGGCVIAPRLMQAREPDEFREILTRDTITVLTILFAMKGLKSGMCSNAQKKAGFTLVNDTVGKGASKFKRLIGCLNPEGGITALNSKEILARYSNITDKDSLVKMLSTIDKEDGNIAKMFSVEKQKGITSGIKKLFGKGKEEKTPLFDAAKKMFGDNFAEKSNAELIDTVKNIGKGSGKAYEGLVEIVGSNALGETLSENSEGFVKGILNSGENNPITYYARNLASNFETLSLALTAGFLGFGLPKLNEKLTTDRHMKTASMQKAAADTNKTRCSAVYDSIKNKDTFQNFMGQNFNKQV